MKTFTFLIYFSLFIPFVGFTQTPHTGDGPYSQLIIRGVTLIKGDGSPPVGPVDIVIDT